MPIKDPVLRKQRSAERMRKLRAHKQGVTKANPRDSVTPKPVTPSIPSDSMDKVSKTLITIDKRFQKDALPKTVISVCPPEDMSSVFKKFQRSSLG